MENSIFIILFTAAVLLESSLTTLPLIFVCLLLLAILRQDGLVFVLAFIAGIIIDIFRLQLLGGTSLFLLLFLFCVLLYERKYEINSLPFVLIAAFIGSAGYLFLFHYQEILLQAVICALLAAAGFTLQQLTGK